MSSDLSEDMELRRTCARFEQRTSKRTKRANAIGNLIDKWEELPNDLKSDLQEQAPVFVAAIITVIQSVER